MLGSLTQRFGVGPKVDTEKENEVTEKPVTDKVLEYSIEMKNMKTEIKKIEESKKFITTEYYNNIT